MRAASAISDDAPEVLGRTSTALGLVGPAQEEARAALFAEVTARGEARPTYRTIHTPSGAVEVALRVAAIEHGGAAAGASPEPSAR